MKQRDTNKTILQYCIAFVACAILTLTYFLIFGLFNQTDKKEIYKILINGFFSIGAICACFGGLVLIANAGGFDFIAYGIGRFFSLFKKKPNDVKYKTFYDYRTARAEKEHDSMWFLVIVGLAYIAISLIFIPTYNGL